VAAVTPKHVRLKLMADRCSADSFVRIVPASNGIM